MLKPFFRRPSLKGMAGKAIKCLYTMDSDGTTIEENVTNIFNIIKQFGEKKKYGSGSFFTNRSKFSDEDR